MPKFPADVQYSRTHEWVKEEDGLAVVGISDYAQDSLGDIVFVNLPEAGDEVAKGEAFADVESVKAVSDVYSPVTGVVEAVNEAILDDPSLVNSDPYGSWFIKVREVSEKEELLNAEDYEKLCAEE